MGTYAFSQNYADTSLLSVAHPGATVIPAALLGMQERVVTGRELIEAVVAGYQVNEVVTRCLNNGVPRLGYQLAGFHPAGHCGAFGAVTTLGHMRAWDHAKLARALEIACNYACGSHRHSKGPLSSLRIQTGEAIRHASVVLALTEAGLDGEAEMFEGKMGLFSAYQTGTLDLGVFDDMSSQHFVEQVHIKMHCTAHTLGAVLDAALQLKQRHGLDLMDIDRIEVSIPDAHAGVSGVWPPRYGADAAGQPALTNNFAHCVAAVLVSGEYLWPGSVERAVNDPLVQRLATRTEVLIDERLSRLFELDRTSWPASVSVFDRSGAEHREELQEPLGRGLDVWPMLDRKFDHLGALPVFAQRSGDLLAFARRIEDSTDVWADLGEILS